MTSSRRISVPMKGDMEKTNLEKLKFFTLLFLVPGILGLITSAGLSTYYLNTLPRYPDPESLRMIPRNINGYTLYESEREDQRLDRIEYSSVCMFLVGIGAGLVYLQKWGIARALQSEDEDMIGRES